MTDGAVSGVSVILLLAKDAAKTAAFYREVLGIPLVGEEHDGRHQHFACPLGANYFTIQPNIDLATPPPTGGYDFLQLCFSVANLEAFLARAQAANAGPLHPPRPFEHTKFVTMVDPDGRHVRVMTPWDENESGTGA